MAEEKKSTEESQATPVNSKDAKKKKGPLFWLAAGCCGCLVILACIAGGIAVLCLTSDSFKESFEESYCENLEKEGIDPSEDPFGICK